MGFGKRKRQAEPRSRDDPKKPRTAGEGPGQGDGHDCLEGEGNEAEPRKDNGVWSTGNMCNPK